MKPLALLLALSLSATTVVIAQTNVDSETANESDAEVTTASDIPIELFDVNPPVDPVIKIETNTETTQQIRLQERNANLESRQNARLEASVEREGSLDNRREDWQETQDQRADNQQERQAKREERKAEIQANRQAKVAEFKTKRDELKANKKAALEARLELSAQQRTANRARFNEQAIVRINNRIGTFNNRYQTALNQAENLYARLESRVMTLESNQADVSESVELLAKIRLNIDAARDNVVTAAVTSESVVEAGDTKELWSDAKAQYQDAKETLIEIKSLLQQAVKATKSAAGSNEIQAETAAEVETN